MSDLRGLAVATNEVYITRLRDRYGITASILKFEDISDLYKGVYDVIDGTLSSVISDAPLVYYTLGEIDGCSVRALPRIIEKFNYGIAFASFVNSSIVDRFSSAVLAASEDGLMERLADSYFFSGDSW